MFFCTKAEREHDFMQVVADHDAGSPNGLWTGSSAFWAFVLWTGSLLKQYLKNDLIELVVIKGKSKYYRLTDEGRINLDENRIFAKAAA